MANQIRPFTAKRKSTIAAKTIAATYKQFAIKMMTRSNSINIRNEIKNILLLLFR